jgi:hypothetical protein
MSAAIPFEYNYDMHVLQSSVTCTCTGFAAGRATEVAAGRDALAARLVAHLSRTGRRAAFPAALPVGAPPHTFIPAGGPRGFTAPAFTRPVGTAKKNSVPDPDPNTGPDPDPLVRGMDPDPDPSIMKQKK